MDKNEIIERLGRIAKHAVHTIGEEPFIMSLDDGTAVYEAIDIIQQSQPQRTGKWIPWQPDRIGFAEEFYCSECGHVVQLSYVTRTCDFEYCPHCGARMEGEG